MRLVVGLVVVSLLSACRPPGWGRGDDDGGDVDAGGGGDGGGVDAPIDAATTCTKEFRLDGHVTATSVYLTGSFNSWAAAPPAAIELAQGSDGAWTGAHTFPAGLHQYKFVVSGTEWIADPTNPDMIDDGFGGHNSLITCVP